MFDAIRNSKRIVQIFLVLITLPFALWGVDSYVRDGASGSEVAKVGNYVISEQELAENIRQQQERLRASLGDRYDPTVFESPEVKRALLDTLINQKLLLLEAKNAGLVASDESLRAVISELPGLQVDGQFSMERYALALRNQNMSQTFFEAKLREDMLQQQVLLAITELPVVSQESVRNLLKVQGEMRVVSETLLEPAKYVKTVKVSEEAVAEFYEQNRARFEIPEQVKIEYVLLAQKEVASGLVVTEDELKRRYESELSRYTQPEERKASHILLTVAKDAPETEVAAAQAKMEEIAARVAKRPADFGRIAKEVSQDPGSASRDGDLGYFSKGMMVKPFEEAAFALKPGETSAIIRSDFGLHLIRLTGIRPAKSEPYSAVRAQIETEARAQLAARRYAEMAEAFSNQVYEEPDSLQPVITKYKLKAQRSDFFAKGDSKLPEPLNNEKLKASVFSGEAIQNRRNTEAIDIGDNTLIAARVLDHKPAQLRPLASVKDEIRAFLVRQASARMATEEGEASLKRLQSGETVKLSWPADTKVVRGQNTKLTPVALEAVFKAPTASLPAYTGAALQDGRYALYRISRVEQPEVKKDDPRIALLAGRLARATGVEDMNAYITDLRARYAVSVNSAYFSRKD